MAKKDVAPAVAAEEQKDPVFQPSAALRATLGKIKRSFSSFAEEFTRLNKRRTEFAPAFLLAYADYQRECIVQNIRSTFIGFVRLLDPTVPLAQADYRLNSVYNAALYLQRNPVPGQARARRAESGAEAAKPARGNLDAIAMMIQSFALVMAKPETLWMALQTDLGFTPRQVTGLKGRAARLGPLVKLPFAKPVEAIIVHPVAPAPAVPVEVEAAAKAVGVKRRKHAA